MTGCKQLCAVSMVLEGIIGKRKKNIERPYVKESCSQDGAVTESLSAGV